MDTFDEGLRCQDVHAGLRNVDPNSGVLTPLADTQMIGMAASLASLIRGQDVIADAQSLRAVAAEQLDVSHFAFDEVVAALAEIGFVEGIRRTDGRISRFTETVPFFDDLYQQLGEAWEDRQPTELEQQMLIIINELAIAPIAVEDLAARAGIDSSALPELLPVAEGAQLAKRITLIDGEVMYSPFFGFENPEVIATLVTEYGSPELAAAFAVVRGEQGVPVSDSSHPLLIDAVNRGLLMAPSVLRSDGQLQAFAALPYSLDHELLRSRKPILDKALAVVACLRCGQYYGGATSLPRHSLVSVVDKLLDPNRGFLLPHSSHQRQYGLMHRAGIIAFGEDLRPGGSWVTPRFIDSDDNRAALRLARDLIVHGEQVGGRVGDDQARQILTLGSTYASPMQTVARVRTKVVAGAKQWQKVIDAALGRGQL
jgi:hypothetical protein